MENLAALMKIQFDTAALATIRPYEYAVRFIFGGLVTVMAGLIARDFGPELGGLFLAFPAIFPASATLIEKHEREKKENQGAKGTERGRRAAGLDAAGSAMGSIGLLAFAIMVWQFLPGNNSKLILAGATLLWLTVAISIWAVRSRLSKADT